MQTKLSILTRLFSFGKKNWEKPHMTNSLWMPIIKEKYENIPEQVKYSAAQSTLNNVLKKTSNVKAPGTKHRHKEIHQPAQFITCFL